MELVAELPGHLLTGLALDAHDDVFAICACSGKLFRLDKENGVMVSIMATESSPHNLAIDRQSGDVYFTDRAENAIFKLELSTDTENGDKKTTEADDGAGENVDYTVVRYLDCFESKSFVAPTALAFAPDGELFFTDAGAEGDSSFADPVGAVYRTLRGRSQVLPLCSRGLIRPAGIAVAPDRCVYVCEQGTNRVLRFVPRGTYYVGNVFAQLQGGMGPVAIAISPRDGAIFVAQHDAEATAAVSSSSFGAGGGGLITVIGRDGEMGGVVRTPSSSLRAIAVDSQGESLYAVETNETAGGSKLYCFKLPSQAQLEG